MCRQSPQPGLRETTRANPVSCLTVTLRRGRLGYLGIIGLVALAAVIGLAVQGCSSPAAPAKAATSADYVVTIAEARAAYGSYITASDTAAAHGNAVQALSVVADAQWSVTHSQYAALTAAHTPVPRYRYGQPVFYVPALTTYPAWFMVAVPRSTDNGGHLGPAVNTIMLFELRGPGLGWALNGTAALDQPMPAIARDSAGYATDMTTSDPRLLLRPDVVGATQAAVVDEGPANAAVTVIGSGPLTTGLYSAQAAIARAQAAKGLSYQWLLGGDSFPQFQMRTADGGALVLYSMYLNTSNTHPNLVRGSPIPVPAVIRPLLLTPSEVGYHGVWANWTYEFVAIDPPLTARNAKVEVIAAGSGPTYGHAS
jgi:hypothetical protein